MGPDAGTNASLAVTGSSLSTDEQLFETVAYTKQVVDDARALDMRASPYDLRDYGFEPIAIETAAGRAEYIRAQQSVAERAGPLRAILAEVRSLSAAPGGRILVTGYWNVFLDGAAIPANPGVNPSLTITALAERAMSFIPPAAESQWNDAPPVQVWIEDQNPHILKKSGAT